MADAAATAQVGGYLNFDPLPVRNAVDMSEYIHLYSPHSGSNHTRIYKINLTIN